MTEDDDFLGEWILVLAGFAGGDLSAEKWAVGKTPLKDLPKDVILMKIQIVYNHYSE